MLYEMTPTLHRDSLSSVYKEVLFALRIMALNGVLQIPH